MSEANDFDLIAVTLMRVQSSTIYVEVPKGWTPALWQLRMLAEPLNAMVPDSVRRWSEIKDTVLPHNWYPMREGSLTPHQVDGRPLIAKLPTAAQAEEGV
jgi:hypothetical protein